MNKFKLNCRLLLMGKNLNRKCKTKQEKNMLSLYVRFKSFMMDQEGQGLVEYGLIVALIALACVAGLNGVASSLGTLFGRINGNLLTAS
jgi:pilus assembly protein Flp/PilA